MRALQRVKARRELAMRLKQPASSNAGSSLVAFDDPATRSALRAMLAKQGGQDVAAAASSPASGADDRAAYEAMFDRIAGQQSLSPGAIRILATRRADRIAKFLTGNGIERSRVLSNAVKMKRPSSPAPASKGRFAATLLEPRFL
ncbi:MAG: hypothetical protein M3Y22_12605 [Pseudomonadota bacterium]|nr:hypothetical protein [Pseudomonadota bacterium]